MAHWYIFPFVLFLTFDVTSSLSSLSLAEACTGLSGCQTYKATTGNVCLVKGSSIYPSGQPFISVSDNYVAQNKNLNDDSSDDSKAPDAAPKVQLALVRYNFSENQVDKPFVRKTAEAGETISTAMYQWKYFMAHKTDILNNIDYPGIGVFYLDVSAMDYFDKAECSLMSVVMDHRQGTTTSCPSPSTNSSYSYLKPNQGTADLISYVTWLNNTPNSAVCGQSTVDCSTSIYKSTLTISASDFVNNLAKADISKCYDFTSGDVQELRHKATDLKTNSVEQANSQLTCTKKCHLETQPKKQYVDFNCDVPGWTKATCVNVGSQCLYEQTSTIPPEKLFIGDINVQQTKAIEMAGIGASHSKYGKDIYVECIDASTCLIGNNGFAIDSYLELSRGFKDDWNTVLTDTSYGPADYITARFNITGDADTTGTWYDWDDVVTNKRKIDIASNAYITITVEIRTGCGLLLRKQFTLEKLPMSWCGKFSTTGIKDLSGNSIRGKEVCNSDPDGYYDDFSAFSTEFKFSDYASYFPTNAQYQRIECYAKIDGTASFLANGTSYTVDINLSGNNPKILQQNGQLEKTYFALNFYHDSSRDYFSMPTNITCAVVYKAGNGSEQFQQCVTTFVAKDCTPSANLASRRTCRSNCISSSKPVVYGLCRGNFIYLNPQTPTCSGTECIVDAVTLQGQHNTDKDCCTQCQAGNVNCAKVNSIDGFKRCKGTISILTASQLAESPLQVGLSTAVIVCTGLLSMVITGLILGKNFYRKQTVDTETGYTPLI